MTFGAAADSNLNHDRSGAAGYGMVVAGAINLRLAGRNGVVEAHYETALHAYLHGSRWDRMSHSGRLFWERDLPGRWRFATTGEFSLKGSSEDRELSDQYQVQPRLEYRMSSASRLRAFMTYRLKRYDDDPTRNATSPQAGVDFRYRLPHGRVLSVGARHDWNDAVNPRFTYRRWTTGAQFETPIGQSDRLELKMTSRVQRYPARIIEVDDADALRLDQVLVPSVSWVHVFRNLEWRGEYQFEARRSNDLSKAYRAHWLDFLVVRRW